MRNDDVMAQVRAANPISEEALSRTDRRAIDALREGIIMTDRQLDPARTSRRRLGRRGVVAAALSITVIGGGAAYAAYDQFYVGGAMDGLTCMTQWHAWSSDDGWVGSSGGPALTGDPVADCQSYQELNGGAAIEDPVAFDLDGQLFVAPRSQLPAGASVLDAPTPQDSAQRELEAGLRDWVDGLRSHCYPLAEAAAFVEAEQVRLGLTAWRVETELSPRPESPCAGAELAADRHTVVVFAQYNVDPDGAEQASGTMPYVFELRDALRANIAAPCLGLDEAKVLAEQELGTEYHWPLTAIVDPSAACTRVDMEVGGSVQVTLRGPAT